MFGPGGGGGFLNLGGPEVLVIGAVAWAILGPKELYKLARQAGEVFANSEVFNNPVAGKLIGLEPRTLPPNPHLALTSPQPPFSNPNSNPDPRQACSWACS